MCSAAPPLKHLSRYKNCNMMNRWRNYFSDLMNVHRISDVSQKEIHRADKGMVRSDMSKPALIFFSTARVT
jgi:hypothetical protein